ncbi:RNA polymerase sigma factor [Terasakiella sp. A23]|uniref:RNA polymerase sigma factor n=1 Tax=Terasakiella sp. FCG-A23 TaxID=3080561 RepID=UPI002954347E|nr:RNA polymerase sigma factor [Terasakiella sp. A23]MDV7340388.1 RNA polymerase sigma factor [Terasakiella sp. A23]
MTETQKLIIENLPNLRRYALSLAGDREKADDLVQDCLVRAMARLHLWEPGSNMRTWLFSILHNLYINNVKRAQIRPDSKSIEDGHNLDQAQPANQEKRLIVHDIDKALSLLPLEQKEVILLVGLEQLTYDEAADVLGISKGTVMSRLHRGREKLKSIMGMQKTAMLRSIK